MIQYIKNNHGNRASSKLLTSVHANERFELDYLKKEVSRMCLQLGIDECDAKSDGSEMHTESSDDDYVDELPQVSQTSKTRPRNSVSAEAFGTWNRKEDFVPRVIPKTDQV